MARLRPRRHAQHVVNAWSWQHVLFELYRYAPDPAESIPKHAHEDYQFCLSLDWPGEYSYRGTYYAVPAGSLSVVAQGLPIGRVAQAAGFADQSHLTRHFKRLV